MSVSPTPLHPTRKHRQTLRLAWAIMLVASGVACLLLFLAGYLGRSYHVHAMASEGGILIIRGPSEWVKWQRKAHTIFEQARDQQEMEQGERIGIVSSAGYGQVATIRLFDQSTIDMWARADLTLETLQTSQWNYRQQVVVLRQEDGYIRYDVRGDQAYEQVLFQVLVGDTTINLEPGGSYSVEFLPSSRRVLMPGRTSIEPGLVDVAVRSGSLAIQRGEQVVALRAGQRLLIEPFGPLADPLPAIWELIEDNTFSRYSEAEYNNTTIPDQPSLPRARTWRVFSGAGGTDASGGFFRIAQGCAPPETSSSCMPAERQRAAWFIRRTGQNTNFTTGVVQQLGPHDQGTDISEYRSLIFSIWTRVLFQSLDLAGDLGTECPVMIRFLTKEQNPTDPEEERVICIYTSSDPSHQPVQAPGITYYRAEQYEWFRLQIDLRDPEWLPEARYLRSIEVYANGHDYDSRATDVSLIGLQYAPDMQQHHALLTQKQKGPVYRDK